MEGRILTIGSIRIKVKDDGTLRFITEIGVIEEDELLHILSETTYCKAKNRERKSQYRKILEQVRIIATTTVHATLIIANMFRDFCNAVEQFCTVQHAY